jgi:(1->4)-alpha-D-glucan 1-alpha-D-glucosylmutase
MDPIEELLTATLADIRDGRRLPDATYRLQFHSHFTFHDARCISQYLHELGVSHCYASPYLKSRPGSTHGYDITNHQALNPEIGSEDEYAAWVESLGALGLGHILDFVPNHMGIAGNENAWWNDVLENGPASPYARFFDIDWRAVPRPELLDCVLLPVLGEPYGSALEAQQIRLAYEAGTFLLRYFDHRFPIAPRTYEAVLAHRLGELEAALGTESPELMEYQSILTAVRHLPDRTDTDPERVAEGQREKEVVKRRLAMLEERCQQVRDFINRNVEIFNGIPDDPRSFDLLDQLITVQAYRLSFWRVASDEINYRRFFDVNELAALSMERPEVFEATHELVMRLLAAQAISGLRIDHPDGLYDPHQYLERLQRSYVVARAQRLADSGGVDAAKVIDQLTERLGEETVAERPLYVVVEKILGKGEELPADWPVEGTSGYDFLNVLNGLFVDPDNTQAFTRLYDDWLGEHLSYAEMVYQKKFLILQVSLSSELHMLGQQLDRLAQKGRSSRDFSLNRLRHALREIIACFPVYRSYVSGETIRPEDRQYVLRAVGRAKRRNPAISASIFDFVRDMLLLRYPASATAIDREEQRRFAGKFQQVTGPVMAKGVEDTAFYVYNRLISLNEVGGDPDRFGVTPAMAHDYFAQRQARWPHAISSTSTHDTKRSEDVRARLNVLSELPDEWRECLARWSLMNVPHRVALEEMLVPGPNEEYFFTRVYWVPGHWGAARPLTPTSCGGSRHTWKRPCTRPRFTRAGSIQTRSMMRPCNSSSAEF